MKTKYYVIKFRMLKTLNKQHVKISTALDTISKHMIHFKFLFQQFFQLGLEMKIL